MFIKEILRNEFMQVKSLRLHRLSNNYFIQDKNSRGETPYEILQSNSHITAQTGFQINASCIRKQFRNQFENPPQAKDECSRILKPKEEKGKLEDEADKLLAMREKLKKDKEEAEKKRLAEENAAAEAKSWDQ